MHAGMPKPGFPAITVPISLKQQLQQLAETQGITIPKLVQQPLRYSTSPQNSHKKTLVQTLNQKTIQNQQANTENALLLKLLSQKG
jgi:hypothetical protein